MSSRMIEDVRQQHAFFDLFSKGWLAEYEGQGRKIYCGRGCSGCCSLAVHCSFAEAVVAACDLSYAQVAAVAAHVELLREIASEATDLKAFLHLHRARIGGCPLLAADGSCGIYRNRPLSCRSLHSTLESRWCATDFAAINTADKDTYFAELDRSVVAFPTHYVAVLQDLARELEDTCNRRMGDEFGWYLYGNMPVLLFLVRSIEPDHLLSKGKEEIRQILTDMRLDHPYLLSIGN